MQYEDNDSISNTKHKKLNLHWCCQIKYFYTLEKTACSHVEKQFRVNNIHSIHFDIEFEWRIFSPIAYDTNHFPMGKQKQIDNKHSI